MEKCEEIRWWEVKERPDKAEAIKKIESRSKEQVVAMISHLPKRRDSSYVEAKHTCFEGMFINSSIYDKQIGWICDFLKI